MKVPDQLRRADRVLLHAVRHQVVVGTESRPPVELPLVLEALPPEIRNLLARHLLAVEQAVELADLVEVRHQELTEARRVDHGVHDLRLLGGAHGLLVGLARLDDEPRGVVGSHRTGAVGDARGLEGARVPGGDRLPLQRGDPVVLALATDRESAVADRPAELGALGDLAKDALRPFGIAELEAPRVHVDGEGGTGLDRVDTDLVAQPVEVGDVLPARDRAVRAEQGQRLELESGRLVVALRVVDDVAALDDAARHAVVHAAAALLEALHDAHAIERMDVGRSALDPVLVRERVELIRLLHDCARAPLREGLLAGPAM